MFNATIIIHFYDEFNIMYNLFYINIFTILPCFLSLNGYTPMRNAIADNLHFMPKTTENAL